MAGSIGIGGLYRFRTIFKVSRVVLGEHASSLVPKKIHLLTVFVQLAKGPVHTLHQRPNID